MPERKTVRVSMRQHAPLANVRVEETAKLVTYTKGDPEYQITEDDGAVVEAGRPLRDVLMEAVNGEFHRVGLLTGKQYTFSLKHLEHADPDTMYVDPHLAFGHYLSRMEFPCGLLSREVQARIMCCYRILSTQQNPARVILAGFVLFWLC